MKKISAFLLMIFMSVLLVACANNADTDSQYDYIVELLEQGNYDEAIIEINALKETALEKENENKAIQEIEITTENWDQYFEITEKVSIYYDAFDEIESFRFNYGLKLKDEYELAPDPMTEVAFEVAGRYVTAKATVDFSTGEYTFEKLSSGEAITEKFQNTYIGMQNIETGKNATIVSFGYGDNIPYEGEQTVTREFSLSEITEITKTKGTLYIYEKKTAE